MSTPYATGITCLKSTDPINSDFSVHDPVKKKICIDSLWRAQIFSVRKVTFPMQIKTLNVCWVSMCCWLDLKCYITTFKMKSALCLLLLSFSLQREFSCMSIIISRVNRFQMKSAFSIFFSGIKCQSMESIESTAVKKPGETLTLSCRGSGFSFSCCSMHWIRQQAVKPLVWMGRVYSGRQWQWLLWILQRSNWNHQR